jgi:alkylhydroperoxidase family enzyme
MDIGSAVGRAEGITDEQLAALPEFETSEAFDAREKLVLRLVVRMTATPAEVSEALFTELRAEFDEAQLVELAATIAWENYRSRFNRAFDLSAQGFSEGAFCVIPEHVLARRDDSAHPARSET